MKNELPALGIMKTGDYETCMTYKVSCECQDTDHDIHFEVEADHDRINVNTFVTVSTNFWNERYKSRYDIKNTWLQQVDWIWKDIINGLVRRILLTRDIWFRGKIQYEVTILMTEQQALNYASTIKHAIDHLKK